MAKHSIGRSPSRIRFVMVDAELGDGDISDITQAIQNALRPPTALVVKRIAAPPAPPVNGATVEPEDEAEGENHEEADLFDDRAARVVKTRAPRKPAATPDVVDIDMTSEVSLATFAAGKDAGSQHKKYLIAAAWLKEHRRIDAVTAGHIYTCFRSMGWSINIPDFWQPLRDLKAKKYFVKNASGAYEINHIGIDYVAKLGGANGAA